MDAEEGILIAPGGYLRNYERYKKNVLYESYRFSCGERIWK